MRITLGLVASLLLISCASQKPVTGIPMGAEYLPPPPVIENLVEYEKPADAPHALFCLYCDDCTSPRQDDKNQIRFVLQRRTFLLYILETVKDRLNRGKSQAQELLDLVEFATAHVKRGTFNIKVGDAPPAGRPSCALQWTYEWNREGREVLGQSHDFENRYYTDPVFYEGELLREYQMIREGNEKKETHNPLQAPYTSRSYATYLQANYYRLVANRGERQERRISDMIQAANSGFRSSRWAEYMRITSGVDQAIAKKHMDCVRHLPHEIDRTEAQDLVMNCLAHEREQVRQAAQTLLENSQELEVDSAGVVWRQGQTIADPDFARDVERKTAKITSYLLALYDTQDGRRVSQSDEQGEPPPAPMAGAADPEIEGLADQVFSDWALRALLSCSPDRAQDTENVSRNVSNYLEWLKTSSTAEPLLGEYRKTCSNSESANPFLKINGN